MFRDTKGGINLSK